MVLEELIPAIFLLLVLILVLPAFLTSNSELKQILKNISIWSLIVVSIIVISHLIFEI
tara:strand:+ start:110 stop:283 length:174 start_codon:yes stop_codon:yes gene_type:complete